MTARTQLTTAFLAAVMVLLAQLGLHHVLADNSTTPTKVNTFVANTTIDPTQVNKNFDDLFSGLANIGQANIIAGGVGTSNLAASCVSLTKLGADVNATLTPTGAIEDYVGLTAPSGWVLSDGNTIGDGSSAATERANADTSALFTLIWNSITNTNAPVSGGRGLSASADFAAHKTIQLPDLRGRATIALDNLGGSASNRVTVAGGNFDGTVMDNAGGLQNHVMTTGEMPSHTHAITDPGHNHTQNAHNHTASDSGHTHAYFKPGTTVSAQGAPAALSVAGPAVSDFTVSSNASISVANATATNNAATTGISVNASGSGSAFTVLSPTYVVSKIIKL